MNEINIRQVVPGDSEELARFAARTFLDAYSGTMEKTDMEAYLSKAFNPESVRSHLESKNMLFHVAEKAGEMLGYTKLRWDRNRQELKDLKAIELERIYVTKSNYRNGTGSFLFSNALHVAGQLGFEVLWLAVWKKNLRAINFYQKFGMEIFGEQPFIIGNKENEDFVLKLRI